MAHVQRAIAAIEPHDSQERFEGLGIKVVRAEATFRDADTVVANGDNYRRRGASSSPPDRGRPFRPSPASTAFPISPTRRFSRTRICRGHLVIIGGGPIGIEMAPGVPAGWARRSP